MTATTDSEYSLSLKPGSYVVCEVISDHPGWTQSFPTAKPLCSAGSGLEPAGYAHSFISGETFIVNDFGNHRELHSFPTRRSSDLANGAKNAGEPGLNGWTINAYTDTNGNGKL